jgi:hypothetical protein
MIEILSSNLLVYRHGGEFSPFIGARIVAGIMWFITYGVMIRPNAPVNIIGRRCVVALSEVFRDNLPTAVQKTRSVLEFCMTFGNGVSLPHLMSFSYLQRAWVAANLTLQDLMSPVVDRAVDPNDRNCPICLNPVLHMKCWKVYKNRMALYVNLIPKGTVTECSCEVSVGRRGSFLD